MKIKAIRIQKENLWMNNKATSQISTDRLNSQEILDSQTLLLIKPRKVKSWKEVESELIPP
jgi:hypothetical protein